MSRRCIAKAYSEKMGGRVTTPLRREKHCGRRRETTTCHRMSSATAGRRSSLAVTLASAGRGGLRHAGSGRPSKASPTSRYSSITASLLWRPRRLSLVGCVPGPCRSSSHRA
jgi:hypothetical protein